MILGSAARVRRFLHGAGLLHSARLPRPVVSVGNLAMGGTGKTPHVLHLARWLSEQGRRVGVLSRGYGRTSRGVRWVSYGEGAVVPAAEGGDEPVLIARSLPGVPVVVGESRYEAGRELLSKRAVDLFLLDDGFQHLSLHRDVDLLLVECGRGLGNRMTAPLGTLREPPSHARFADALVITKCPDGESGRRCAASVPFPEGRPRAFTRFVARGLVDREGRPWSGAAPGDDVFAFSGLARNDPFRDALSASGFRVKGFLSFPDHHRYAQGDLDRIARDSGGLPVITTEKDMVRLAPGLPFSAAALRIDVEYLDGWEPVSRMILERLGEGRTS